MEYNKVYFNLYYQQTLPNQVLTANVGLVVKGFNMRTLLGNLFYKYNAFAIKLESYNCRSAATADVNLDFLLFHIAGLNFINGFDTSPNYRYSRALEVIDFGPTPNANTNFISNCNTTAFYKPTSDTIDLTFFYTKINDEGLITDPDNVQYIFSITGIDAYKTQKPERPLVIRPAQLRTVNFTLRTNKAEIVDSRRRAFRFKNINLRNIIGEDYDKYSKFCLITKYFNFVRDSGITFHQSFSGFILFNLFLSGPCFISSSKAQYSPFNNQAEITELEKIHLSQPAIIGLGAFDFSRPYESYIENAFYKSSEVIDISISYGQIYRYALLPVNTANSELFPHLAINFDIIGLD